MPYKMVKKAPRRKMMKRKQINRSVAPSVSPTVKQYVKRMLSVKAEDKNAPPVSTNALGLIGLQATFATVINLSSVWQISQGTGSGNRIANSVTPKSWIYKGFINSTPGNTEPLIVKMFIIKYRNGFNGPIGTTSSTDFFQNGNGTIGGSGNYLDVLNNVNTDTYQVYMQRSFKIGPSNLTGFVSNNDFSLCKAFKINLLKYQRHALKYNDGATTPTNSGLYAVFAIAPADGSNFALVQQPSMSYVIDASYEDA